MTQLVNRSEKFVYRLCRRSFLALWSNPNPRGKEAGKELCDVLIVCDPHVIVISVKDVDFKDTGDVGVDFTRWRKRAIEESVKQLYGAERKLRNSTRVVRSDGTDGLPLPPPEEQIFHRVAVACGGRGEVPIPSGDFGKVYVHVMSEESFWKVLGELDTVSDFTRYLAAKEAINARIDIVDGSEADLLAFYLLQGRTFPQQATGMLIEGGMWEHYVARPEVKEKKKADEVSYGWDRLIDIVSEHVLAGTIEPWQDSSAEAALRTMAREDRLARRILGEALKGLFETPGLRARIAPSPSGVVYVMMQAEYLNDRTEVHPELTGRCFLARGFRRDSATVVGVAILTHAADRQQSVTLCRLYMPEWTARNQEEFDALQTATGGFKNLRTTVEDIHEYPSDA